MRSSTGRRYSPATLISLLALVVALGGSAYASHLTVRASDIVKKAVRAKHIKPEAVRPRHIKPEAVRGKQVQPKSVKRKLGIRSSGLVRIPSSEQVFTERVLARSGPIRLVAECQGGGVPVARLLLRSNTGTGNFIGVRYSSGESGPELMRIAGPLSGSAILAATSTEFSDSDQGATFTAWSSGATLSGEARVRIDDGCSFSFDGVAG